MGRTANGTGSTRQLEDGSWECVISSKYINPKTGKTKRIKRKGKTESEARKNARMATDAWEKDFERGKDTKINKRKTFGAYMNDYIEEEVKPNITASAYLTYVSNMKNNFDNFPIAKLQLHMLSSVEFENYFNSILALKSKKTCSLPIQLCRRCCQWLVDRSLLKDNYAKQARIKSEVADEYNRERDLELKSQKKVFTPEDIEKFYYAYKNNVGQYPVVVLFLLETGLRCGEFASLRNSNIDLERNRIDIVESRSVRFIDNDKSKGREEYVKVPKNGEKRFVMLSKLARECVLYMQEQTKLHCANNPDDLLYPTFYNGKRRSNASMEVGFKTLCDKIGVDRDVRLTKTGQKKGLCLHSLRHTADTIANTAKGANVVNTALMMGHKSVTVENTYTHATEEALSTVMTPSQAILQDYKRDEQTDKDKELYELYLKLKDKFE